MRSLSKKKIKCGEHLFMVDKTFILTDKIEFVPDEDLEGELNFNLRAAGYVLQNIRIQHLP